MKYSDARAAGLFKDGDIIFLPHLSFRSWKDIKLMFLKMFDMTRVTHAAMIKTFGDRLWIVESVQPYVRIGILSEQLDQGGFWWASLSSPATEEETVAALAEVNKKPYSQIRAVLGKLGFIPKDKVGTGKFVSCAEWVMGKRRISKPLGLEFDCDPTPSALKQYLEEHDIPVRYILKG